MITLADLATVPRNDLDALRDLIRRKGWPSGDILRTMARLQDEPEKAWPVFEQWRREAGR